MRSCAGKYTPFCWYRIIFFADCPPLTAPRTKNGEFTSVSKAKAHSPLP